MRRRMEGPTVDALAISADQPLRPRQHLLRCASRERQEQNSLCLDAALDQVRDTIDERARLASASARDDEKWPITVCSRGRLFRIQL